MKNLVSRVIDGQNFKFLHHKAESGGVSVNGLFNSKMDIFDSDKEVIQNFYFYSVEVSLLELFCDFASDFISYIGDNWLKVGLAVYVSKLPRIVLLRGHDQVHSFEVYFNWAAGNR